MRQTHTVQVLQGTNERPVAGTTLKSSQDFITAGIQAGYVVRNQTTGKVGTVSSVTDLNNLVTNLQWKQGDFFEIDLPAPMIVMTNIGPVYESICGLCGVEAKRAELEAHDGRCTECYDKEKYPTAPND